MRKPNLNEVGKILATVERMSLWLKRKEVKQKAYVEYLETLTDVPEEELINEQIIHGSLVWALSLINNSLEQLDRLEYFVNKSNKV
jgi:hypothetical protein